MMRTLRDMNMSKFVAEDVPLFLSLIDDLFPGLKAERSQFPEVMAALEKVGAGWDGEMGALWCGTMWCCAKCRMAWLPLELPRVPPGCGS